MSRIIALGIALLLISGTSYAVDPLTNGNFQSGNTGWTFVTIDLGYGFGTAEINTDPFTLNTGAHVDSGAIQGRSMVAQQLTGLSLGENLSFTGIGSNWSGTVVVGFFRNDGAATSVQTATCPGSTGNYVGFNVAHTVTANDISDGLWVGVRAGDNGNSVGYIDNVSISGSAAPTPSPSPTPAETPTPFPTPSSVGHSWSLYR